MTPKERQEWLAERRKGIGGSDVAAILGVSPWATPLNVWLDKTGRAGEKPETEAMRIGTELEDFVARRYTQETGRTVQRFRRMLHKGCLLGNLDRLVVMDGQKVASHQGEIRTDTLLECKTASIDWNGEVPLQYLAQVLHYLGLDPMLRHADVAALNLVHKHFEVFRVERDDEAIAAMQAKLEDWWERYVVADVMPPPVNEDDCRLAWAVSKAGKSIVADDDILWKLDEYRAAKDEKDRLDERVKKLKGDICAFMKDAATLTDAAGNALATWKNIKDSTDTDWESLAKSLNPTAEQIAAYTVTSSGSRVFRLKAAKAAKPLTSAA